MIKGEKKNKGRRKRDGNVVERGGGVVGEMREREREREEGGRVHLCSQRERNTLLQYK